MVSSGCTAIWRVHSAQRSVSVSAGFGAESLFRVVCGVTVHCGGNVLSSCSDASHLFNVVLNFCAFVLRFLKRFM